jgi:hypothetical protein
MTIKRWTEREEAAYTEGGALSRPLAQVLSATACVVLAFGAAGCGRDHDELPEITKQAVKFDDVPENVRAAASKAIPGVKFNEAWKNLERGGKLHSYEIRGKNASDGKTREVRVSLTGEILETE